MQYNRSQMKEGVKVAMKAANPPAWQVALLFVLVSGVGAWLIERILGVAFPGSKLADALAMGVLSGKGDPDAVFQQLLGLMPNLGGVMFVSSLVMAAASFVWNNLMGFGLSAYVLGMVRGENPPFKTLFVGFYQAKRVLLANLWVLAYTLGWSLAGGVVYFVVMMPVAFLAGLLGIVGQLLGGLVVLAVTVVGALFLLWLNTRYRLVNFVLANDPACAPKEAVNQAKVIFEGNMADMMVLSLSFVGWYLLQGVIAAVFGALGLITMGLLAVVGQLILAALHIYLLPYVEGSFAAYYLAQMGDGYLHGSFTQGGWDNQGGSPFTL